MRGLPACERSRRGLWLPFWREILRLSDVRTFEEIWRDPDTTDVQIIDHIDEDLVLVAVTVTLTPGSVSPWTVPDYTGPISVTVDGASSGGGGSGGADSTISETATSGGSSSAAGNSSFNATQTANGGGAAGGGADAGSRTSDPTPGATGSAGANGTAAGGDTNTTGGAAAAAGVGGAAVTAADAGSGTWTSGAGGNGGKGGRSVKSWAYGVLKPSSTVPFTVGAKSGGGAAGTCTNADGTFRLNGNVGSAGNDGAITIVYTAFSFGPVFRKTRNYIETRTGFRFS
jgi:hypothetical protein